MEYIVPNSIVGNQAYVVVPEYEYLHTWVLVSWHTIEILQ
jgi:hypothetical protein